MSAAPVMQEGEIEFVREELRRTSVKRWCDCGCVIDGGEPYLYEVWKIAGDDGIHDLETCEPCAVNYSSSGGWYRAS